MASADFPPNGGTSPGKSIFPVRPRQPGGAPSGMKLEFHRINPLEIFHATHYCLTRKICIFNIFSELSVVCAHAHAGHTHCANFRAAPSGVLSAASRLISLVIRTGIARNPPQKLAPDR